MNHLNRIIGIETRRSGVVPVALLVAVPMVALILTTVSSFEGRWLPLAVTVRTMLQLALPLVVGGGAWLGMREHRHHLGELLASSPRSRARRIRPLAISLAGLVTVAYLTAFAAGLPRVLGRAVYVPMATLPVTAVGALSLVAAGWLGLAAGRAVPRLILIPVLVVLSAGLTGIVPSLVQDSYFGVDQRDSVPAALWLTPVWTFTVPDFDTVTGRTSLLQAIALLGLAVTGLLLASVGRRGIAPALVPAAAGLAGAALLLPASGSAALADDARAFAPRCSDAGPQICVSTVHAYQLDEITAPAQQVLTRLAVVPGAPTRAAESRMDDRSGRPVTDRAGTISFTDPYATYRSDEGFSVRAFQQGLADQAFLPDCDVSVIKDDYDLGVAVIGAWLAGSGSLLEPHPDDNFGDRVVLIWDTDEIDRGDRAIQALRTLPGARQTDLVRQVWTLTRTCRPEAMTALMALGKA
ncbi:hypothetical protein [Kineosporia sp. NBRC 101731]|uniref:hypothetical protein n=1 Tax=Kineosporia sp. NBRC 101731 TaxID=3032199 RepID=UPI0024A1450D|nr:hypothetical protein [Kineosporia sp. NBRC 101731]GLY32753.1 hypothetical protein Kisp02_61180 [Kineosporia sp. NBRC 101731]